jgi:pimeloyl-ACP methyl ester carboxylesterase
MKFHHRLLTCLSEISIIDASRLSLGRATMIGAFYLCLLSLCLTSLWPSLMADGPADNSPSNVRRVPPKGMEVPAEKLQQWKTISAQIMGELDSVEQLNAIDRWQVEGLLRGVKMTAEEEMFYSDGEIAFADRLLQLAAARVAHIRDGKVGIQLLMADAEVKNGSRLLIGAFQSRIDRSLQPFGLVVPENWQPDPEKPMRLDVWLHGRDEKSGEVGFWQRRSSQPGEFVQADSLVLHPYGRYSNAFKFAGEVDVLEGIDFVSNMVPIDPNRVSMRGFSMGGAGCWQLAVHYPDRWFVATPGAGFCETTEFLRIFQKEEFKPTTYQQDLLHWYDCPDWSSNLRYLPTIAYSGELDRQKQAADMMEQSLRSKGIDLPHIIGPQTEHKYHPDAKVEIANRVNHLAVAGRVEYPERIDFTTFTLRYARHSWISIERLGKHWSEARIQAERTPSGLTLQTLNIDRFSVKLPVSLFDVKGSDSLVIKIDNETLKLSTSTLPADRSTNPQWRFGFERVSGKWERSKLGDDEKLAKRPGLQGPIDDAFLDAFLFVGPNREKNLAATATEKWIDSEFAHARAEWKRHFRGDVLTESVDKLAGLLSETQSAEQLRSRIELEKLDCHWVLFGSPESNPVIGMLAAKLPIAWSKSEIRVGEKIFDGSAHSLCMIYPNPWLPNRYIVLNSGFTFREFAYLNNARQIPMLPDWAIIDTTSEPTSQLPGKVLDAGFFDESWLLK